jgi:GAF domain-containing protein
VGEPTLADLLQSVVEVARATVGARASSILWLDEEADELVVAAVAGEGSVTLSGRRIPSSTAIAGPVLATGKPLVVDDLAHDSRFALGAADGSGYLPREVVAVPLLRGERTIGALEVLDRDGEDADDTYLLGLFARQAAIVLALTSPPA